MAEKFLDIVIRAKNQSDGAFAKFNGQLKDATFEVGKLNLLGIGVKGAGIALVGAAIDRIGRHAAEAVNSLAEFNRQLQAGSISSATYAANIVEAIPVFGVAGSLAKAITQIDYWEKRAIDAAESVAQRQRAIDAAAKARAEAKQKAENDANRENIEQWRKIQLAGMGDFDAERARLRYAAIDARYKRLQQLEAKLLSTEAYDRTNATSALALSAEIAKVNREEAEARAKEAKERAREAKEDELASTRESIQRLRARAAVTLPDGTPLSARFGGLAQTYKSQRAAAAQQEAVPLLRRQTKLLEEIRDLQRKPPAAQPILIGA